jgi:hypothetical protein
MNERIKQLAEQAGLKVESWMTNPPKPFQILGSTEQFEKFAELIVRECANAADMAQDAGCEYAGDYVAEYMGYGQEEGVTEWRAK